MAQQLDQYWSYGAGGDPEFPAPVERITRPF